MTDLERFARLNARQRECLRLVYANLEAKEIARALEISSHTVNEHLRDARRILGVSRSMEAARQLADSEGNNRVVHKPIGVERNPNSVDRTHASRPELLVQTARRNRYSLSVLARIALIVVTAVGAVALAGALLVGAEAITRVFRAEQVDISDPPYRQ